MLDKLKEFRDTLYERVKSPFIGSFMITWGLIHWKVFLLLFYSESNITIKQRIESVESYLQGKTICSLIITPILITLLILLCYSVLNAVGLLIKLLYDNWASPYIQKFVYNKNIVEKSKYEKLKLQYTTVKKDYDTDKESYINTEKEYRETKVNFESFKNSSFAGQQLGDITQVLDKNHRWENFHTYPDGKTGSEIFTTEFDGFILTDGAKIRVKDIKTTSDRRILTFTKVIDEMMLHNYLIMDGKGDYYGIENNNIVVTYRKIKQSNIVIESAKYGGGDLFFNITKRVAQLVEENADISAMNEIWGDPNPGVLKTLEIKYKVDGVDKSLSIPEGETKKIE